MKTRLKSRLEEEYIDSLLKEVRHDVGKRLNQMIEWDGWAAKYQIEAKINNLVTQYLKTETTKAETIDTVVQAINNKQLKGNKSE